MNEPMITAREYLKQAYRLDLRIDYISDDIKYWKEKSESVSSVSFERHYSTNRSTEAPFLKCLDKMYEAQEQLTIELDLLVTLRKQIHDALIEMNDEDEKLILQYRYLKNYTWDEIGEVLHVDERTARRWHVRALENFVVPENAINIKNA